MTGKTNAMATYSLKAEGGVIRLSPYGFLVYARQFLEAAQALPQTTKFSPVPYYLLCRSLELSLKAYLLSVGHSKDDVRRKIGHNLCEALLRAEENGLTATIIVTALEIEHIGLANEYYANKGFEYFSVVPAVTGYPRLPDLAILECLAGRLVSELKPICLESAPYANSRLVD